MGAEAANLPRVELRCDSIEPPGMYRFELGGIDTPLSDCDLQPVENGRQGMVDLSAFVGTNDPAGPVDQGQVFLEAEQNAALEFVGQPVFEGQ